MKKLAISPVYKVTDEMIRRASAKTLALSVIQEREDTDLESCMTIIFKNSLANLIAEVQLDGGASQGEKEQFKQELLAGMLSNVTFTGKLPSF